MSEKQKQSDITNYNPPHQVDYSALEEKIGHTFADKSLITLALTHSSFDKNKEAALNDNERLEFLGDRVLGLSVADMIFSCFPSEKEGVMAKRHAALVKQETLVTVAESLRIGKYIRMSVGEEKSGGREKPSILSDAVESLIAAIYIDAGFEVADKFIQSFWSRKMKTVRLKDPKSHLQEWLQSHKEPLPTYELVEKSGEAHNRTFTIKVVTEKYGEMLGEGASKQQAEQDAAAALLYKLQVEDSK